MQCSLSLAECRSSAQSMAIVHRNSHATWLLWLMLNMTFKFWLRKQRKSSTKLANSSILPNLHKLMGSKHSQIGITLPQNQISDISPNFEAALIVQAHTRSIRYIAYQQWNGIFTVWLACYHVIATLNVINCVYCLISIGFSTTGICTGNKRFISQFPSDIID